MKKELFIVSGPSGAGKTTLIKNVLKKYRQISYSVSYTTRKPRKNERHGIDYFFISPGEFKERISRNLWLEWAEVNDNYYGTSGDFVKQKLEKGESILIDVDVRGAKKIFEQGFDFVSVFIMPPSFQVLRQRLEERKTDSEDVILKRLANAEIEMRMKDLYKYIVINDDFDIAFQEVCMIFEKEIF